MEFKKGIIVAGGRATRLHPATLAFGKQMLPVFDKPMMYYPLSTLLMAGIREILIVTTPRDHALFKSLLGDGSRYGAKISYVEQPVSKGIADAFVLGESFIGDDNVCLILGDNFFYGPKLQEALDEALANDSGATIFCYPVDDPRAYGVATLDADGKVTELVEKPANPASNWAVTGIYFYDNQACKLARQQKPSARGEMEITDVNIAYMKQGNLKAVKLDKDFTWFDLGTHASMLEAGAYVRDAEKTAGRKIGCPDQAAFEAKLITKEQLIKNAERIENKDYADYLRKLAA